MSIYLPIAEIPLDIFLLIAIGSVGGFLAGLFGIGGGFLITPVLIFLGIPPAVSVATSANQIIASSLVGFMGHWQRKNVDFKMGLYLLCGGLFGSLLGIEIFSILKKIGQIDLAISLFYIFFLGIIGTGMFLESGLLALRDAKILKSPAKKKRNIFVILLGLMLIKRYFKKFKLPLITEFPRSNLKISALLPASIGIFSGILVSLMGIGGGFITIPAMIYILRMPNNLVVGTSLFQIIFITSLVTILHAISTQTVDIVLACILIVGGVLGAQLGNKVSLKVSADKMRLGLSIIILAVCIKLGIELFSTPAQLYTINFIE